MAALIAQEPAPAAPQGGGSILGGFAPLILVGLFFLVVVLPAMRRQKRDQANTLSSLKPGVKVVTSAGIVGSVVTAKDGEEYITIRSADSRIQILRSSVVRVVADDLSETK